jgi:hypothetical protein
VAEPTVRELLIDRIDVHCRLLTLELDQVRKATEQLAPERARLCRNAITMASVMIDEIRLRAHARPPDTDELSFPGLPPKSWRVADSCWSVAFAGALMPSGRCVSVSRDLGGWFHAACSGSVAAAARSVSTAS